MKTISLRLALFFVTLSLFSLESYAQQGGGGQVALMWGLSVPDAENTTDHTVFGILGGARMTDRFGFGGYHLMSNEKDGPNSVAFSFKLTGLEARYYLSTGEKNIFISFRGGIAKVELTQAGTEIIYSPYHYGFASGYGYRLFSRMVLGIEGSFLAYQTSETTSGVTKVQQKSFHTINFLAFIQLLF